MPTYHLTGLNGKTYSMKGPPGLTEDDVYGYVVKFDPSAGIAPPPPKTGMGAAFQSGAENMWSSGKAAVKGMFGDTQAAATEALAAEKDQASRFDPQLGLARLNEVYEKSGLLSAGKEMVGQGFRGIAQSAPEMATMIGGAKAGSMAGARFGPTGALIGGIGGGILGGILPHTGRNLARQERETPGDVSLAPAITAGAGQAALESVLPLALMGGRVASKVLGVDAAALLRRVGPEAAEEVAKRGLMATAARGTAIGAGGEAVTEVMQEMLSRVQAGQPLLNDEALRSYGESAYGGALPGGILGAAGHTYNRMGARGVVADKEKAAADAEAQIEGQRVAAEEAARTTARAQPEFIEQVAKDYANYEATKKAMSARADALSKEGTSAGAAAAKEAWDQVAAYERGNKALIKDFNDVVRPIRDAEQAAAEAAAPARAEAEAAAAAQAKAQQVAALQATIAKHTATLDDTHEAYVRSLQGDDSRDVRAGADAWATINKARDAAQKQLDKIAPEIRQQQEAEAAAAAAADLAQRKKVADALAAEEADLNFDPAAAQKRLNALRKKKAETADPSEGPKVVKLTEEIEAIVAKLHEYQDSMRTSRLASRREGAPARAAQRQQTYEEALAEGAAAGDWGTLGRPPTAEEAQGEIEAQAATPEAQALAAQRDVELQPLREQRTERELGKVFDTEEAPVIGADLGDADVQDARVAHKLHAYSGRVMAKLRAGLKAAREAKQAPLVDRYVEMLHSVNALEKETNRKAYASPSFYRLVEPLVPGAMHGARQAAGLRTQRAADAELPEGQSFRHLPREAAAMEAVAREGAEPVAAEEAPKRPAKGVKLSEEDKALWEDWVRRKREARKAMKAAGVKAPKGEKEPEGAEVPTEATGPEKGRLRAVQGRPAAVAAPEKREGKTHRVRRGFQPREELPEQGRLFTTEKGPEMSADLRKRAAAAEKAGKREEAHLLRQEANERHRQELRQRVDSLLARPTLTGQARATLKRAADILGGYEVGEAPSVPEGSESMVAAVEPRVLAQIAHTIELAEKGYGVTSEALPAREQKGVTKKVEGEGQYTPLAESEAGRREQAAGRPVLDTRTAGEVGVERTKPGAPSEKKVKSLADIRELMKPVTVAAEPAKKPHTVAVAGQLVAGRGVAEPERVKARRLEIEALPDTGTDFVSLDQPDLFGDEKFVGRESDKQFQAALDSGAIMPAEPRAKNAVERVKNLEAEGRVLAWNLKTLKARFTESLAARGRLAKIANVYGGVRPTSTEAFAKVVRSNLLNVTDLAHTVQEEIARHKAAAGKALDEAVKAEEAGDWSYDNTAYRHLLQARQAEQTLEQLRDKIKAFKDNLQAMEDRDAAPALKELADRRAALRKAVTKAEAAVAKHATKVFDARRAAGAEAKAERERKELAVKNATMGVMKFPTVQSAKEQRAQATAAAQSAERKAAKERFDAQRDLQGKPHIGAVRHEQKPRWEGIAVSDDAVVEEAEMAMTIPGVTKEVLTGIVKRVSKRYLPNSFPTRRNTLEKERGEIIAKREEMRLDAEPVGKMSPKQTAAYKLMTTRLALIDFESSILDMQESAALAADFIPPHVTPTKRQVKAAEKRKAAEVEKASKVGSPKDNLTRMQVAALRNAQSAYGYKGRGHESVEAAQERIVADARTRRALAVAGETATAKPTSEGVPVDTFQRQERGETEPGMEQLRPEPRTRAGVSQAQQAIGQRTKAKAEKGRQLRAELLQAAVRAEETIPSPDEFRAKQEAIIASEKTNEKDRRKAQVLLMAMDEMNAPVPEAPPVVEKPTPPVVETPAPAAAAPTKAELPKSSFKRGPLKPLVLTVAAEEDLKFLAEMEKRFAAKGVTGEAFNDMVQQSVVSESEKPAMRAIAKRLAQAMQIRESVASRNAAIAAQGKTVPRLISDLYDQSSFTPLSDVEMDWVHAGNLTGVLDSLAKTGSTPFVREMAAKLRALSEGVKLKVDADVNDNGKPAAAVYDVESNTITIHPLMLSEENVIHELGHAATLKSMVTPPESLTREQRNALNGLKGLLAQLQKDPAFAREYGQTNIAELASEVLSNKELRDKIDARKPGLWNRLKQAFLQFFGIKTGSAKAVAEIEKLFQPARKFTAAEAATLNDMLGTTTPAAAAAAPMNAMDAFGAQINAKPAEKGLKAMWADPMKGLAAEMAFVDQRAPILKALSKGAHHIYQQAQYYVRKSDSRMAQSHAVLMTGGPKLKKDAKGFHHVDAGHGPSAKDVFAAIGKLPGTTEKQFAAAQNYMVAQRAANKGWETLGWETPDQTRKLGEAMLAEVNANPKLKAQLEAVRKVYNEYNKGLVTFLADTGAIPQREAQRLLQDGDYVPFYRIDPVSGAAEMVLNENTHIRLGDIRKQPYLAQLKGDEGKLLPLNEAIIRNTMLLMDKGLSNLSTKEIAYGLQAMSPEGVNNIRRGEAPAGADVIKFNQEPDSEKDTGERWVRISSAGTPFAGIPSEMLVQSLEGSHTVMTGIGKIASKFGDYLRFGVTRSPAYVIRQLIRDPMSASFTAGATRGPIRAMFKSLKEFVDQSRGSTATGETLLKKGVTQSQVFTGDADDIGVMVHQLATGNQHVLRKFLNVLDRAAMRADAATRSQVYEDALKATGSEMQAELAAIEMMNFTKRGSSPTVQHAARMIPFLNAQVQSLNVLVKAMRGQATMEEQMKIRSKFIKNAVGLTLMSMVYAVGMEENEAYKTASAHDRLSNFYVPTPWGTFKIPIPYEIGLLFKALPEVMMHGMDPSELKALGVMTFNTFPGASSLGMPQIGKPAVEALMNRSIYSGLPIETAAQQKLATEERYNEYTTELAKALAHVPGMSMLGLSPVKIEHLVRGYLGGLPIAAASLANEVVSTAFGTRSTSLPERRLSQMPVFGGFIADDLASGAVGAAYDKANAIARVGDTYDKLVKDGELDKAKAYMEDNLNLFQAQVLNDRFRASMKRAKADREDVMQANISSEKKREQLDAITRQRNNEALLFTKAANSIVAR